MVYNNWYTYKYTMSNLNVEQLLEDEDGEDEYDLGNDEEEALLADDGDPDQDLRNEGISYLKKNSGRKKIVYSDSKVYCETDEPLEEDILELDDCESDLDNVEYAEELEYTDAQDELDQENNQELQYHENELEKSLPLQVEGDVENNNEVMDTDLGHQGGEASAEAEERLQPQDLNDEASGQKESEEEEDEEERQDGVGRDRFKAERTNMISLKGNKSFGNIPDTLDGLITTEDKQPEVSNRWKRGGRGGFSRGGFRGNQRGYNSNFGPRRKQMQGQNRQNNQNIVFPHQRLEGPLDSSNSLLPSPFLPSSHKIHINPHFRGNVQPQPEGPIWNDNVIGNLPSSNSGNQHPPFHDTPRFPPPSMGFNNIDHRDMPMNMMDHHQQRRSPPPQNPFHPSDRSGGYDTSPGHLDYHRDHYEGHNPPMPEAWMNPPQRLQESSIGPPGGHHHQFGGGQQHFSGNHMHSERGTGEVLQHFRPTMQPGPLFSHVNQVAPPAIPQQNLILHQQQLQNLMRSAPPLNNAGLGQMLQLPPQETHNRIPPPGFSPNDGRPLTSLHHGPPSPWQDSPINRSQVGGQHLSMVQQQQQHGGFHQGGPRSFPIERGSNLQGPPLHQIPHSSASMSAPPPPFNSANMPQGPPPHPIHHQHPQGQLRQNTNFNPPPMGPNTNSGPSNSGHTGGRFSRQGAGNFPSGFGRNVPLQQGNRLMRGGGHMAPGRGGIGPRRGATQSVRPMQSQKPPSEEVFTPKRPPVPMEGISPTVKPSPPKKRKLRKIMKSNLHEVETVDTLPDTTIISEKESSGGKEQTASTDVNAVAKPEDAALLDYQRKIEQQKRLREKILQQKEQRRKLTALKKQKELQEKAALSGATHEEPKGNAIATIVNRNPVEPSPTTVAAKKEPMAILPFIKPATPNPENQMIQSQHMVGQKKALMALKTGNQISPRQPMTRGVAMRGVGPRRIATQGARMPNPGAIGSPQPVLGNIVQQGGQTYKIIQVKNEQGQIVRKKVLMRPGMAGRGNPLGRGQVMEVNPQQIRPVGQGRGNIAGNKATQVQVAGSGHRVVQVLSTQQPVHPQMQDSKMLLQRVVKQNVPAQQQQGRKVVVQSLSGGGDNQAMEAKRRGTVVVENLAASTSEADLRKMCQIVGQVLNIQMVPNHRRAIVEFAHPASAVTFFQRYQRKIVDLSMISVRLANS